MRREAMFVLVMVALAFPFNILAQEVAPKVTEVGQERISLGEAIQLGRQHNVDMSISSAEVEEAEYSRKAMRGNFGPKLSVDANIMRWNKATEMNFMEGVQMPDPSTIPAPFDTLFQGLGEPMTVRDQVTKSLSVTLTQPITPLYGIYYGYRLASLSEDASKVRSEATRRATDLDIVSAYLGTLMASRFSEIASTAVTQVESHRDQAEKFFNSGLIAKNDYLKAEIALAEAKQSLIDARSGVALSRSSLNRLIGKPHDAMTTPEDPNAGKLPEFRASLDDCIAKGLANRMELKEIGIRADQAQAGEKVAWSEMIPTLAFTANWQRQAGSSFQDKSSWYVGGVVSWTFWEWGAKYYQIGAASAKAQQAELGKRKAAELITLEIKKSYLDLRSAEESLVVSQATVEQARENFRITQEKFAANTATSTDVIDAQSLLTISENRMATDYYKALAARASLQKAIGDEITLILNK